jgi:hypothetical protein
MRPYGIIKRIQRRIMDLVMRFPGQHKCIAIEPSIDEHLALNAVLQSTNE